MEVYLGMIIPQRKDTLVFGVKDLKVSYNGGIVGDATLGLLADYVFTIGGTKSIVRLKAINDVVDQGCFVKVSCEGFESLSVDGQVEFSRNIIIPVDANDKPIADSTKRVIGTFSFYTENGFNDVVASLSLPHFTRPKMTSVVFHIDLAVIDLSDLANEPGMVFPANYFADTDAIQFREQ